MKKDKTNYNSEITKEDLKILGDREGNLRNDLNEDEYLKERSQKVDFTGKELDIPGRKLKKNVTSKKIKDEENELYSLGSDDNENLEIDSIN